MQTERLIELMEAPAWLPGTLKERMAAGEVLRWSGRFSKAERRILRKRPRVPVSKWCARHRVMSMGVLAGSRWKNDLTPYLAGIMDASFFPSVQTIIVCATPQTGKSESVHNCIGYATDRDPGPALYVYPDRDTARENAQDRIQPMFERSARLREYLTGSDDDVTNYRIRLTHMPIYLAWARSASRLANKPIRYLVLDEIDKYPDDLRGESDPISLAEKRTTSYQWNRKIWKLSTPTIETGAIWTALTTEAQAIFDWHVKCPECRELQKMVFSDEDGTPRICWPADQRDPEIVEQQRLAWYECRDCGAHWDDRGRDRAVRGGSWIERASGIELAEYLTSLRPAKIGFHIPAWISPFVSMSASAAAFLKGLRDKNKLKDFQNAHAAAPWKIYVQERKESAIMALRDDRPRGIVPGGGRVAGLTAGVDTQDNGLWYQIMAWSYADDNLTMECWVIREGYCLEFGDLAQVLWSDVCKDGAGLVYPVLLALQDAGGHRTSEVYDFARINRGRLIASFGRTIMALPFAWSNQEYYPGTKKPIPGGLRTVTVNTKYFKDDLSRRLAIAPADPGAWHYHAEFPEAHASHMVSEFLNEKDLWECPSGKPNHLWDCSVLGLVAADILGLRYKQQPQPADEPRPAAAESYAEQRMKQIRQQRPAGSWMSTGM